MSFIKYKYGFQQETVKQLLREKERLKKRISYHDRLIEQHQEKRLSLEDELLKVNEQIIETQKV